VIQDDIILLLDNGQNRGYQLDAGQSVPIPVPAQSGSTYRLIALQDEFNPRGGYPTAYVEGCIEAGAPFQTGFVTLFPEQESDPTNSVDVQEIIRSDKVVELRGYPKPYGDSLIIDAESDITYTIFFRNTGTDTVKRVVIRDTLSASLDITTLTPGVSNFPYQFEVYDAGILKVTFDDIELLPGGNIGDAGTYGFIKFRVAQKPDNPVGTLIENQAAVYFDYLEPEKTNSVRYFSGVFPSYVQTKITTDIEEVFWPGVEINMYPNPFIEAATIELEGYAFKEITMKVFDAAGRLLKESRHLGNKFMYYRNALPAGLYFFRLESEGQLIGSGKMLVR
jgi:uncharacterized repeat protein (TIGR01451 family)